MRWSSSASRAAGSSRLSCSDSSGLRSLRGARRSRRVGDREHPGAQVAAVARAAGTRAARGRTSPGTRPRRGRARAACASSPNTDAAVLLVEPLERRHRHESAIIRDNAADAARCETAGMRSPSSGTSSGSSSLRVAARPGAGRDRARGGDVGGAGRRRRGRRACSSRSSTAACDFFTALGDDELGRARRGTAGRARRAACTWPGDERAASARGHLRRRRRRADDHRARRQARPARETTAARGSDRPRRRLLHLAATPRRSGPRAPRASSRRRAHAADAARRRRSARRARRQRRRRRRAVRAGEISTAAEAVRGHARRGRRLDEPGGRIPRRRCPGRSSTRTAPATRSPRPDVRPRRGDAAATMPSTLAARCGAAVDHRPGPVRASARGGRGLTDRPAHVGAYPEADSPSGSTAPSSSDQPPPLVVGAVGR